MTGVLTLFGSHYHLRIWQTDIGVGSKLGWQLRVLCRTCVWRIVTGGVLVLGEGLVRQSSGFLVGPCQVLYLRGIIYRATWGNIDENPP